MRLVVVLEKFWLAILRKDKLIEFRSSNHAILLNACQCLLFALPMRHRRNGKGALICARVLSAELLDVDQACAAFPREAEDCNLTDLAARWGVTFVRCIALDKDSIRIADEITNLSMGCQGIVHQFALKTGVPHFCHARDLGKTVSFTLPDGKVVYRSFRRHDCDSRERSADEATCIGEAAQGANGGDKADDPREALDLERGGDRANSYISHYFSLD